jgi:fructuronate reductase
MTRLSLASLAGLPSSVSRPAYDPAAAALGIVHLGVGAFHRAHQAVAIDDRLNAGETGWAILGASLRAADTRDALTPQNGLYSLLVRSGEGTGARVIGSLRDCLVAPESPERLVSAMTDPAIRIVSLTVTEKGYCHDPASGTLREDHPDVIHDLAQPGRPRSAPGFLVEALRRRRHAGVAPFTVMCCDNLPANGRTVARVLAGLARLRDPDLAAWIEGEVACPATMVDRIVPATTQADREEARALLGVEDAWPVATEPFSQWVIEDRFTLGRPRLEDAGAEMVSDVAPYELMKLRLLNGTHSTMAYLGFLAGHETVADVIGDPAFAALIPAMMREEIAPTLPVPAGADTAAYQASLISRYRNPALRHRTAQIAMDGSQKLPQRLLGTARDRLAAGAPIDRIALAVAGWMRYVAVRDEQGRHIEVKDPMASRLNEIARGAGLDAAALAGGLLTIAEIFGTDLPADPRFREPVTAALACLIAKGAAQTVRDAAKL